MAIQSSIQHLRNNFPVALPTETVYGLAAVLQQPAIEAVYQVKQRPADNPLIVHVSSIEMALSCCELESIPDSFYQLTEAFWPGPLTLVLKCNATIPDFVTRGLDTVAIRMPQHEVMQMVIRELGAPLVAPSANLSGRPSPTKASHVLEDFDTKIPLVIDGGPCEIGVESTVLDVSTDQSLLLRPGDIAIEQLETVLGQSVEVAASMTDKPKSPGMKYRHYAPRNVEIILIEDETDFLSDIGKEKFWHCAKNHTSNKVKQISKFNLYDIFRLADESVIDKIYVLADDDLKKDAALWNRIQKAASK